MTGFTDWLQRRRGVLIVTGLLVAFPFVISFVVDGQGFGAVVNNEQGNARFLQGLAIVHPWARIAQVLFEGRLGGLIEDSAVEGVSGVGGRHRRHLVAGVVVFR